MELLKDVIARSKGRADPWFTDGELVQTLAPGLSLYQDPLSGRRWTVSSGDESTQEESTQEAGGGYTG